MSNNPNPDMRWALISEEVDEISDEKVLEALKREMPIEYETIMDDLRKTLAEARFFRK